MRRISYRFQPKGSTTVNQTEHLANAAGRLRAVCVGLDASAAELGASSSLGHVLAHRFEDDPQDRLRQQQLLGACAKLTYRVAQQVRERVEPDMAEDLLEHHPRFVEAFASTSIHMPYQDFRSSLPDVAIESLKSCSIQLRNSGSWSPVIPDEILLEWHDVVQDLGVQIRRATGIPALLRDNLLRHIRAMLETIELYELWGTDGLEMASGSALLDAFFSQSTTNDGAAHSWYAKLGSLAMRIFTVTNTTADGIESAQELAKLLPGVE